MAYKTYITEALVCGSKSRNTYDRAFLLFTREGGMVWATARSVRKEKSKQRYALQEFSHIRVSLVSGRSGWRIAGVESLGNLYFHAITRSSRALLRNVVQLLRRTIHGETEHRALFDDVIHSLHCCNDVDSEKLEVVLSLRILHTLGYISHKGVHAPLLHGTSAAEHLDALKNGQVHACKVAIEHALIHSQL